MALSAGDYRRMLAGLMPRSRWLRPLEGVIGDVLHGLAEEFARLHARAEQLIAECDPSATDELLPDWERVLGLPAECITQEQTEAQRKSAVLAAFTAIGGQSRNYFIGLAAALGYTITIEEFDADYADPDGIGEPGWTDEWQFVWRVHGAEGMFVTANAGEACAGDPLSDVDNELLPCLFGHLKPAHTLVLYAQE